MRVFEIVRASGHPKIRATHATTLEITKEAQLTDRGNCIVAVDASKGAMDLSLEFHNLVKNNSTIIKLTLKAENLSETVTGRGDPRLTLDHPRDLVARRSAYVCSRTIMLEADKSSSDLSRELVGAIRDPHTEITIILEAQLKP